MGKEEKSGCSMTFILCIIILCCVCRGCDSTAKDVENEHKQIITKLDYIIEKIDKTL